MRVALAQTFLPYLARRLVVATLIAALGLALARTTHAQLPTLCGDLDASGTLGATDALLLLKKAVAHPVTVSCPDCTSSGGPTICGDLDANGTLGATDALLLLKRAVGQAVTVQCPGCSSGTTTTTLPVSEDCGNGTVDVGEECEQLEGCPDTEECTAECTCEPAQTTPPSSQSLIKQALANGTIDYPTALLYRVWALYQAPELPEAYDGAGTLGEDTGLFFELSHARESLPQEIETQIAPYLVRPNDPTSIFSQDPGTIALNRNPRAPNPPPIGCALNALGQPDWRYTESAGNHFVVWSCGGGVGGTDPYAGGRSLVGNLAEEIHDKFEADFVVPLTDDYDAGPEPKDRIDIYILVPNQCRLRGGACVVVPGNALAAASPASPCRRRDGGGALTSSAYIIVGAAQLPASGGDSSDLRYILTHELFHAASFRLNLGAQGGICPGGTPDLLPETQRSWLTEASAEWSSFAFYPEDMQERRTILFEHFQKYRGTATQGLQNVSLEELPYQAFLYPAFIQEESGQSPETLLDFWISSGGARTREDLDRHLDQTFSFAENFRNFAVRNLNLDPPGDPIFPPHSAYDPALTLNVAPFIPEPALRIEPGFDLDMGASIAPLFAQYEHFYVHDDVVYGIFDFSDVPNMEHLRIDAIVKVGNEWERREVDGPIFSFCRNDDEDRIDEIYLVLSNTDKDAVDGAIEGTYKLEARAVCPGGWSGSLRWVTTLDRYSHDVMPAGFSETFERHIREEQHWSVIGTEVLRPPQDPFEAERLLLSWRGTRDHERVQHSVDPSCGTTVSTESGSGGGAGGSTLLASPFGPGVFGLGPEGPPTNHYELPLAVEITYCNGGAFSSNDSTTFYEAQGYLIAAPGLNFMQENPPGSGRFSGSHVVLDSFDPMPGGGEQITLTVYWDLTRTPAQ